MGDQIKPGHNDCSFKATEVANWVREYEAARGVHDVHLEEVTSLSAGRCLPSSLKSKLCTVIKTFEKNKPINVLCRIADKSNRKHGAFTSVFQTRGKVSLTSFVR